MLSQLTQDIRQISNSQEKEAVESEFAERFDADLCQIQVNGPVRSNRFGVTLEYYDFDSIGSAQDFIEERVPGLYNTISSQSEKYSSGTEKVETLQNGIMVKVSFSYDME